MERDHRVNNQTGPPVTVEEIHQSPCTPWTQDLHHLHLTVTHPPPPHQTHPGNHPSFKMESPSLTPTTPSLWQTAGRRERTKWLHLLPETLLFLEFVWIHQNPHDTNTRAVSVVSHTPPPPTWAAISRHIAAWTVSWPRSVHIVTRCTWACQLYPCTSWRTASNTSVLFVTRLSPDPGYFRATWDLTLERSLMDVLIVVKPSQTAPTFALTCKLTPPSSTTRVNDVTNPSLSSPTSTNITSLPALKTCQKRVRQWA